MSFENVENLFEDFQKIFKNQKNKHIFWKKCFATFISAKHFFQKICDFFWIFGDIFLKIFK